MLLFAKMGGAPPTDEAVLFLCGLCPVLPLVVLSAWLAVSRGYLWPACLALLLAGSPLALLLAAVAGYEPSDDWEVVSDQAVGRRAVGMYALMTALAALSVPWAAGRRLKRRRAVSPDPGRAARRGWAAWLPVLLVCGLIALLLVAAATLAVGRIGSPGGRPAVVPGEVERLPPPLEGD